eukprot:11660482-Alexandrium_andersonii.AAC.1
MCNDVQRYATMSCASFRGCSDVRRYAAICSKALVDLPEPVGAVGQQPSPPTPGKTLFVSIRASEPERTE